MTRPKSHELKYAIYVKKIDDEGGIVPEDEATEIVNKILRAVMKGCAEISDWDGPL